MSYFSNSKTSATTMQPAKPTTQESVRSIAKALIDLDLDTFPSFIRFTKLAGTVPPSNTAEDRLIKVEKTVEALLQLFIGEDALKKTPKYYNHERDSKLFNTYLDLKAKNTIVLNLVQWAAKEGYPGLIEVGNLNQRIEDDNLAIQLAVRYEHFEAVEVLLQDKRVDPSVDNNYLIQLALEKGYFKIVELLLRDSRVDPSTNNNYAIRFASQYGHTEVVKLLLADPRVDPSALNNTAIQFAAVNGHLEVVKLLLLHPKVDPTADKDVAIRFASRNGHTEVVKLLLSCPQVNPGVADNFAIKVACENGHVKVVELLLADSRVERSLNTIEHLLYLATSNNKKEVLEVLNKFKQEITPKPAPRSEDAIGKVRHIWNSKSSKDGKEYEIRLTSQKKSDSLSEYQFEKIMDVAVIEHLIFTAPTNVNDETLVELIKKEREKLLLEKQRQEEMKRSIFDQLLDI